MNNTCYDLLLEAILMCNMLEDQLSFPLYACSREAIKRYRPFLEALGLTYTQYIMLLAIWEEGCISVRDLGRKLYLDSGTLTPVLKHLEQVGFITRRRWEKDERVLIVTITDKGLELRARAQGGWNARAGGRRGLGRPRCIPGGGGGLAGVYHL
jgi:DNA-binding MarR family transcriptional regulator